MGTSPDGDFVVVWASAPQDGSGWGIFSQRYGDILFQDGFESGDLTRWSSASTDGGDVSVTGGAAMANTTQGMQVVVDDTTGVFVRDDSPSAEAQYRARFYFDTNGFDPGEAQSHLRTRLFIAFDNASQRQITIVLRRMQGQYSVMGRVRLNDGTRANTGFVPIPTGPNFVEFAWNRATRAGTADGDFLLIVNDDDEGAIRLTGLDDGLGNVEFARLGAMSVKTGASGALLYDQFESRRSTRIGPECRPPLERGDPAAGSDGCRRDSPEPTARTRRADVADGRADAIAVHGPPDAALIRGTTRHAVTRVDRQAAAPQAEGLGRSAVVAEPLQAWRATEDVSRGRGHAAARRASAPGCGRATRWFPCSRARDPSARSRCER